MEAVKIEADGSVRLPKGVLRRFPRSSMRSATFSDGRSWLRALPRSARRSTS